MKPVLTAAEMRAAEQRSGVSVETLMERAGAAAAQAIWHYAGPLPALVLCGPGNNGGDGHVIARILRQHGIEVQVATLGEPRSDAARGARDEWHGPTAALGDSEPATLLVDALFGTGLTRALEPEVSQILCRLAEAAAVKVAIDLPSGIGTDDGAILSPVPDYDLTIALGALKPAHLLQPAARHMGRFIVADIGVETGSDLHIIDRPLLPPPGPDDHKYTRGYVTVVAGEMPGAAALAATAAAKAGAGYVRVIADAPLAGLPAAIVQGGGAEALADQRIGAVVVGPGLGRSEASKAHVTELLALDWPLVIDADALFLLDNFEALTGAKQVPILTPHAGEFARLFGSPDGNKVDQARAAARRSGSVVFLKGADTVIAAPDGRAAIAAPASAWLASAGTGDVLAGIIAALRARGLDAFEAACAGAWLHARAAVLAGPGLIADDLLDAIRDAAMECR